MSCNDGHGIVRVITATSANESGERCGGCQSKGGQAVVARVKEAENEGGCAGLILLWVG
jgi:hypothetical protein